MPSAANNPGKEDYLDGEDRENVCIRLAMDLAERRLREGTASAQEVTHFLKLGSTKERMERQLLEKQIAYTSAKTAAMVNPSMEEEKYNEVLEALKEYGGISK